MSEPNFSIDRIVAALEAHWGEFKTVPKDRDPDDIPADVLTLIWNGMPDIRALILSLPELECERPVQNLDYPYNSTQCTTCSHCLTNETRRRLTK